MKRSVVPAQITTVEDKVIGNLSPYQVALISSPLLFGIVLFAVFPHHFHFNTYKLWTMVALEVIGATLSIRVHDMMLVQWLLIRVRYNIRPRLFVFDKNSNYLRSKPYVTDMLIAEEPTDVHDAGEVQVSKFPDVALSEIVRLEGILSNPHAKLRFQAGKKGKLNVVINEIKQ